MHPVCFGWNCPTVTKSPISTCSACRAVQPLHVVLRPAAYSMRFMAPLCWAYLKPFSSDLPQLGQLLVQQDPQVDHMISPSAAQMLLCGGDAAFFLAFLHRAPRFWTSQCIHGDHDSFPHVELWTDCCASPLSGIQPQHGSITLHPGLNDTCLPESPYTVHAQVGLSGYNSTCWRR